MPPIASTDNKRIKEIRALQRRAERDRTRRYFVDGVQIVGDAVRHGAPIETLIVAPEMLAGPMRRWTPPPGLPCLEVTRRVYESLARSASLQYGPQGIGAVIRQRCVPLSALDPAEGLCWVALETPQQPGNLGTVLRTCDAVGAAGVILLGPATDPYDPASIRASMGAVFSRHLVRARLDALARWKAATGIEVVGAVCDAPRDYRAHRYRRPTVLLMGDERVGLTPETVALCDVTVSIPMVGACNSLNLGVATGVMLYEIFTQHRGRPEK
ncbi:MAG TPA: RNA methyltransferase [Chloroflexota bacterium]|nr:RNA methyltransferase [Chloroflexota bacterium]